ncbi:MAG: hypothetical protein ACOY3I_10575 [Verrucomicrobiota bacterium]
MRQPLLRQRLGQQLIKAAYPRLQPVSFLYQVGIIGNLAFYATTPEKKWDKKLEQYFLELEIQKELHLHTVDHAIGLFGTAYEKMARNALAGFVKQWSFVSKLKQTEEIAKLKRMLKEAKLHVAKTFKLQAPQKLISRQDAERFLRREAEKRLGKFRASHINYSRYLAPWSWPQVNLFQKSSELLYSPQQLQWIAQKTWPTIDDPFLPESLLVCSRYGV